MEITPVPTVYAGTRFASTLEADWAAMFDKLGWYWQYEPEAFRLPEGDIYRPDFCLPSQRVWCEVKGPHNDRLDKAVRFQNALNYSAWEWESWLVVILRPPGPGETAAWHGTRDGHEQNIVLLRCSECKHYGFMDYNGLWMCRRHLDVSDTNNRKALWRGPGGELLWPNQDADFVRAPRPTRKRAA